MCAKQEGAKQEGEQVVDKWRNVQSAITDLEDFNKMLKSKQDKLDQVNGEINNIT